MHQQRYASTQECLQLIKKIDQEYDIEAFEGFVDVPVAECTLDEVLSIKAAEDELMGKNDNPPLISIPETEHQLADENFREEEDPLAWLYT